MNGYRITLPTGNVTTARRVTEVIRSGMPRPALVNWELRQCVDYATRCSETDVDLIISEWRRGRQPHMDRGTHIHRYTASLLTGSPPPALMPSQKGYAVAATAWIVDRLPALGEALYVEHRVTTPWGTVAGTLDAMFSSGVIVDWKTAEAKHTGAAWPDQEAQLGAYASLRFSTEGGWHSLPEATGALVVRLFSDGTYAEAEVDLDRGVELWQTARRMAELLQ